MGMTMVVEQGKKILSKESILKEYEFLINHKSAIFKNINSNGAGITNQFDMMAKLIVNDLEKADNLNALDVCLDKINTYIAIAFLNLAEDNDIEFKYITRLTSLLFKMHLNRLKIIKTMTIKGAFNDLVFLPPEIGYLKQLETLDLDNCKLTILPKEIGLLKNLHILNLDYNQISIVPSEICELTNLEELHLRHNHLKELPIALARLAKLRKIDISENEIDTVPNEFSRYIH